MHTLLLRRFAQMLTYIINYAHAFIGTLWAATRKRLMEMAWSDMV